MRIFLWKPWVVDTERKSPICYTCGYVSVVVRHQLSGANIRGSAAFGSPEAHLVEQGRLAAAAILPVLHEQYGVDAAQRVAVSTYNRTAETAWAAGFSHTVHYKILNEVEFHSTLTGRELRTMLDEGALPPMAITQAMRILLTPPREDVWFTHGLVIAGLCALYGVHQDKRLVPKFGEIRELPTTPSLPQILA